MGEGKGGRRGTDPSTPEGRRNPWCLSTAAQPTPDRPSMPMQPSARPQVPRRPLSRLGVRSPPCVAPSLGDTCRVGWGKAPAPLGSPPREAGGAFVSSRGMPGGGVRNGQRREGRHRSDVNIAFPVGGGFRTHALHANRILAVMGHPRRRPHRQLVWDESWRLGGPRRGRLSHAQNKYRYTSCHPRPKACFLVTLAIE